MTEYTRTPVVSPADPTVSYVSESGDWNQGLWVVPEGVESFSVLFSGGVDLTTYGASPPLAGTVQPVVYYDVPCTPGETWIMECGDGPYTTSPVFALDRNTLVGGDGYAGYGGIGGCGATIISRRTGIDEVFAIAGGRGGSFLGSPPVLAVDGPVSYGGFTDLSGASNGANQVSGGAGGGGGAGWPGGAAGTGGTPGESGGSYLPDVSGASLGAATPSPTWGQLGGADPIPGMEDELVPSIGLDFEAGLATGKAVIWYFTPGMRVPGWAIDETRF